MQIKVTYCTIIMLSYTYRQDAKCCHFVCDKGTFHSPLTLFLIYNYLTVSIIKQKIGNSWLIMLNYGWQSRTINNVRFRLDCKIKLAYIGGSENHLSSCFRLFAPKFCHSMIASWVVGTLRDDGNPQTKPAVIEKIELLVLTGGRDAKISCLCPCTHSRPSHLV